MRFGVDIGGTNIKFVVIDGEEIKYQNCIDTVKNGDAIVNDIITEYKKVTEEYEIEKMGISIPGYGRDGRMSGRLFFEALHENCPVANKVFDTYLDYLAVGIKSINMVFGPDAIVLAGAITKEGEKIL